MKKVNLFIIKSFIGPFIITFTIAMLFLIMQFFWKYVDDIMGKGVDLTVLFKLLFYLSADVIPLALPIAVLFSSIMTMGNLAESNELTAMKSSGMSLFKVMRPMLSLMIMLSVGAFYFSNYILPIANLKLRTIIYDLQQKPAEFLLTEGVFFTGIEGFTIKVDKKNSKSGELEGVLIYEEGGKIVRAEKGELLTSENKQFLLLKLVNGSMYEEAKLDFKKKASHPFRKSFFKESTVKFDMGGLDMQNSDEEMFKREYQMMNFVQLGVAIDSFRLEKDSMSTAFKDNFMTKNVVLNNEAFEPIVIDSLADQDIPIAKKTDVIVLLDKIGSSFMNEALSTAQGKLRAKKDYILMSKQMDTMRDSSFIDYVAEWHRKFTLAFSILVLFFVGAPLGAIIKKGGLGAPLIFATLFFLLYYILLISGENMIESRMISPFMGSWMASFVLVPIGLFLTYKAANDSALFDIDVYKKFFRKLFKLKNENPTAL